MVGTCAFSRSLVRSGQAASAVHEPGKPASLVDDIEGTVLQHWAELSENRKLFFHQIGQSWSYRAPVKAFESSPRDLAVGHGFKACSLKNKRNKLDLHTFWGWENGTNKRHVGRNVSNVGPWSSK